MAVLARDEGRVLPSFTEPLASGFVEFLGGRPGRHALIGRQRLSPQVVLTLTAMVFLALAYLFRVPCITGSLVDAHWDPSPHRPAPTSAAGTTEGATAAAASSGTAKKYPKVLPPEGAPVPPARIEQ